MPVRIDSEGQIVKRYPRLDAHGTAFGEEWGVRRKTENRITKHVICRVVIKSFVLYQIHLGSKVTKNM